MFECLPCALKLPIYVSNTISDYGGPVGLYIIAVILLLPLAEIAVFIWVGGLVGVVPTILLTVFTALAGTFMLRQQGLSLAMRLRQEMDAGRVPGDEVLQGAMIVFASIFLLIPGFITDFIGLLLFVPPLRAALVRFSASRSQTVFVGGQWKSQANKDGVVDLDEGDWSETSQTKEASESQPKLCPWKSGSEPQ